MHSRFVFIRHQNPNNNLCKTIIKHWMPQYNYHHHIHKNFCTFINKINNDENQIFNSVHSPRSGYVRQSVSSTYPHNVIQRFSHIHRLKQWKKRHFDGNSKLDHEQIIAIYTSLIAKCADLCQYDYAWHLFNECKQNDPPTLSHMIFVTMQRAVYEQYVWSAKFNRMFINRKGAKIALKLQKEMQSIYNIAPSVSSYGVLIKILVGCQEYDLAENVWNEYLNQSVSETTRKELFTSINNFELERTSVENSVLWNHMLSNYRKQNKMKNVFEMYQIILNCNVIRLNSQTFVQIQTSISQIIATLKEKDNNVQKNHALCMEYIHFAEKTFIDAHKLCDDVYESQYNTYRYLFNSLFHCYVNAGLFHVRCRNFWNVLSKKDKRYLKLAFDERSFAEMDDYVWNLLDYVPDPDQYMIGQMTVCMKLCCQRNANKKYDVLTDNDIYCMLDDILHVMDQGKGADQFGSVFVAMLEMCDVLLTDGRFDAQRCYLYMFKFYAYYNVFGIRPARAEFSVFTEKVLLFLKFHKSYSSKDKKNLKIVHGCCNAKTWNDWIERETRKYSVDAWTLRFDPLKKFNKRYAGQKI